MARCICSDPIPEGQADTVRLADSAGLLARSSQSGTGPQAMADDLEKAKILLAWAARVYGFNKEANEDEYNRFLRIGCQIGHIPFDTLGRVRMQDVVATMLAEDQQAALPPRTSPKRGRPATPHKHLWITGSIEAYIGAGLTREAAIKRAADNWYLAPSSIDKIYRENKLPKQTSDSIRDFFGDGTTEGVDEAIRLFREDQRRSE